MATLAYESTRRAARPLARSSLSNVIYYGSLILWSAITLFIFVWLVVSSLKSNQEVFGSPWALPANALQSAAANYNKAWTLSHLSVYFTNSLLVSIGSVILVLVFSAPAAYALSRVSFRGNSLVTYYFIAGMGLPFQLIFIPLFAMLAKLGLADTLQGLIVTYIGVSIPFTIFLLTGFFRTLPSELEDAASIDGASEFGIFWRVMLPLSGPGLITAAIFNFISIWNEFQLALIIINNDSLKTLPLGLWNIRSSMQFTADWAALFAAVVIVIIPNFLFYLVLSDRVMSGLTLGAGK